MKNIQRTYWREFNTPCMYHPKPGCVHIVGSKKSAHFISSQLVGGGGRSARHAPALDIDHPTTLRLSRGTYILRIVGPRPRSKAFLSLLASLLESELMSDEHLTSLRAAFENGDGSLPPLRIKGPAKLVPSSTKGHFHLYIDREMSWEVYVQLLSAFCFAGIIGEDFHRMSIEQRRSYLLKPGLNKKDLPLQKLPAA